MKLLFLILTILINQNSFAEILVKITHDDGANETHLAKDMEDAKKHLSGLILSLEDDFKGSWQSEETGTVTSRIKQADGSIEYFKPSNFSVEYEDVTAQVQAKRAEDEAKRSKRNELKENMKTRDLTIKEINEYIRAMQ